MGDVLFVWTAAYQTCLMQACVPHNGNQAMFNGVWSPDISGLSRALGLGQTRNVWSPNTIKHCLVNKHFTVWTPCLVLFDRVWSYLIVFGRV